MDSVHYAEKFKKSLGRADICNPGPHRQLHKELLELHIQAQEVPYERQARRLHCQVPRDRSALGQNCLQKGAGKTHVTISGVQESSGISESPGLEVERKHVQAGLSVQQQGEQLHGEIARKDSHP